MSSLPWQLCLSKICTNHPPVPGDTNVAFRIITWLLRILLPPFIIIFLLLIKRDDWIGFMMFFVTMLQCYIYIVTRYAELAMEPGEK